MGLLNDLNRSEEIPQVHLHANAKLTPALRRLLVHRVLALRWRVTEAAEAAGVARQTAYKWLARYQAEGEAGLEDRSCRPHRLRGRTPRRLVQRMLQLRRRKKAAWEIAVETGVAASTVSRHLKAEGLGRLWRIEEALHPPQRYEHAYPGSLFHVDAKRFGRIAGIGHAIHGDRRKRSRGVGWEVVFVCVDDHIRLAYAEVHPSENAVCATRFFRRALRWFESLGVRGERVLTDNAKCYGSATFSALCVENNVSQRPPDPTRPEPTARPSASSRPSSVAGPIATPTGPPR
jgi:transposase